MRCLPVQPPPRVRVGLRARNPLKRALLRVRWSAGKCDSNGFRMTALPLSPLRTPGDKRDLHHGSRGEGASSLPNPGATKSAPGAPSWPLRSSALFPWHWSTPFPFNYGIDGFRLRTFVCLGVGRCQVPVHLSGFSGPSQARPMTHQARFIRSHAACCPKTIRLPPMSLDPFFICRCGPFQELARKRCEKAPRLSPPHRVSHVPFPQRIHFRDLFAGRTLLPWPRVPPRVTTNTLHNRPTSLFTGETFPRATELPNLSGGIGRGGTWCAPG